MGSKTRPPESGPFSLPVPSMTLSALSYGSATTFSSLTASLIPDDANDFVLLFNRSTGSPKVHYLSVDTRKRSRLLPRVSVMTMTKIKDVVGYRVVSLHNQLYIIGGRNLESGAYLSHCYRLNPDNNQWTRIGSLSRARSRFTATALDGCIYVAGMSLVIGVWERFG